MTVSSDHDSPETRILLNGCWDLTHAGHFNALLHVWEIARTFPNGKVVAGIHSNSEIARVKGGTFVYSDDEKLSMLQACRFVDAFVCDVPYRPVDEALIGGFNCAFAVHGSDAVILKDGSDMYGPVKKAGKYIEIPRSENIATTDLIDRILNGKTHPVGFSLSASRVFNFARVINQTKTPHYGVVYILGHFDLFHPGHVEILRRAKSKHPEKSILVGVLSRPDEDILTEGERMICLLACRYVDDVVITPAISASHDFVHAFKISTFMKIENQPDFPDDHFQAPDVPGVDVSVLDCSDVATTTEGIKNRILGRAQIFVDRNIRKTSSASSTRSTTASVTA